MVPRNVESMLKLANPNQVVVPLARDRVTNVRIAASDALYRCMGKLKAENSGMVKETIQPILAELSQDPDPDVKYFAELAMRM